MKEEIFIIEFGREEWSGWKEDNCDTIRAATAQEAVSRLKTAHRGEKTEIRNIWRLDRIGRRIINRIEAPEDCFGGMA